MRFFRVLVIDFKRIFATPVFYLSIVLVMLITFISVWPEASLSAMGVSVYYLTESRHGIGAFFLANSVVIVFPYALSYREDKRNNYYTCVRIRETVSIYSWSKVVATAFSAFIVVFMGYLLIYGLFSLKCPVILDYELESLRELNATGAVTVYEKVLLTPLPWLYFICIYATEAIGYSFLAVFVLMVSAKVSNPFVLFSMPIFLYYGSVFLFENGQWPNVFYWYYVMNNGGFIRYGASGICVCMIQIFAYFISLIGIEGFLFEHWLIRNKAGE